MSNSTTERISGEVTHVLYFNRVLTSATFLVLYDYVLTFPAEVSEMWNSKFTGAQVLFFVTRYSYIVYVLFQFVFNFVTSPSQTFCRVVYYHYVAWSIPPHLGLYAILTLRTYAIYQKSWFILIVLGLTSVATCVIDVIILALNPMVIPQNDGLNTTCDVGNVRPITFRLQLVGQILSLILDILVFGFTVAKTIRHAIAMRKVGLGNSLEYFILRDGAMYFLAKLLFGVLGTILFFIPVHGENNDWLGVLPSMANSLALVLASRLFLNLRQVSHNPEADERTLRAIGTIRDPIFATNSFLGNIGAQLRVGPDDDDEVEEISMDVEIDVVRKLGVTDESEIPKGHHDPSNVQCRSKTDPCHRPRFFE